MAEKQFLTKKGYDERVARLEELKVVRRKEVAQKLKEAREQGDLSENAEYHQLFYKRFIYMHILDTEKYVVPSGHLCHYGKQLCTEYKILVSCQLCFMT